MTFVLAAVAGVAGDRLTGHLTAALVVFVMLLAAGMTVTYLLERHARSRTSGDGPGTGDAAEPGAGFDLRGARGVQFGEHNRQVNYFGAEPGPDRRE